VRHDAYSSGMPNFYFQICGGGSDGIAHGPTELPDDVAERDEGAGILADLARDRASALTVNPEWQLEVLNDARRVYLPVQGHCRRRPIVSLGFAHYLIHSVR
jgi:hypothetical protein